MYIDVSNTLNLSIVPGVGSIRLRSLIGRFKSADVVFKAPISEIVSIDGIDIKTAKSIKNFKNFHYGENQLKKAKALGCHIISFWDDSYPKNLKRIHDPPVLLFIKGRITNQDDYSIAIVGARIASTYGKLATERIVQQLSRKGLTIVSGFARGVDTVAHWTSLKSSNRTIAVLGTGLDRIYPPENKELMNKIIENGAIISEFPFGTGPDAINFPKRNRIIAGLSLGAVVTEAGKKSGALITANLALEYNREVFAVPGNINSQKSIGCNMLIKEGAKLIMSGDDVIEELAPQLNISLAETNIQKREINVSAKEKELLSNLSETPVHIDVLARKVNKSTYEILSDLLTLEFNEHVKQLPGKYFILNN